MTIRDEKHVMEAKSLLILKDFLLPWLIYDLRETDYAIDLYVRIAELNQPVSSETLHIQLKSTEKVVIKDNKITLNSFPTKSLKSFEPSYDPTFIVLCDLENKNLYWVNAHVEINRLNKINPNWKLQKTNTIYFYLPHAELTKKILKNEILRARKRLIIKHSLNLKEDELFETTYLQMEIEKIQEGIISKKVPLENEKNKDFVIAELNYIKALSIENDNVSSLVSELKTTIDLYKKIVKQKSIPADFNIGKIFMRLSNLYFISSNLNDPFQNLNNCISSCQKALKFFNKEENLMQYLIINQNLSFAYSEIYKIVPNENYIINQISSIDKILNFAESNEFQPIIGFLSIKLGGLHHELVGRMVRRKEKRTEIVIKIKAAIIRFIKALEYFTYEKSPREFTVLNNILGDLYIKLAEFENSKENLKKSIKYIELIIDNYEDPEEVADIKTRLGVAYRGMFLYENKVGFLKKAINLFKDSLDFWNIELFPLDFANSSKNLAMCYALLGEIKDFDENIKKCFKFLEDAQKIYTLENYPERYASIQFTYYDGYMVLFEYNLEPIKNLKKAIESLNKALEIYNLKDYPYNYATAHLNLGSTFLMISSYENEENNLLTTLKCYKKALKIFTLSEYPQDYAKVQYNMGGFYRSLENIEKREENLRLAIKAFRESLKIRTYELNPYKYGLTNLYIGNIARELIKIQEKKSYLAIGIEAYKNALNYYTLEDFLVDYLSIHHNLGYLYLILSKKNNKRTNIQNSEKMFDKSLEINLNIDSFKEVNSSELNVDKVKLLSLKVQKIISFYELVIKDYEMLKADPYFFKINNKNLQITHNLGLISRRLSIFTNKKENLKVAIKYFEEALILSKEEGKTHGIISNNIALAYYQLSDVEEKVINLKKSKGYYKNALHYLGLEENRELRVKIKEEITDINKILSDFNGK